MHLKPGQDKIVIIIQEAQIEQVTKALVDPFTPVSGFVSLNEDF
jgi:hypothetical protein